MEFDPLYSFSFSACLRDHRPQYASRISRHDRVGGNIPGNHAPGAHDSLLTNCHFRQNGGTRPDRRPLLDESAFHAPVGLSLQLSVSSSSRIAVIDESHAMPDENLVLDGDPFTDKRVAGDLASLTDLGVLLNLYERPDLGLVTNLAAV